MGAGMACRDASSAVGPMVACWNIPSRQWCRETGISFSSDIDNSDLLTFSKGTGHRILCIGTPSQDSFRCGCGSRYTFFIGFTFGVFTIGVYSTYISTHWWIRAYHGYIFIVAYKLSKHELTTAACPAVTTTAEQGQAPDYTGTSSMVHTTTTSTRIPEMATNIRAGMSWKNGFCEFTFISKLKHYETSTGYE